MAEKISKYRALLNSPKHGFDRIDDKTAQACHDFNEGYKAYLNAAKTERECVREAVALAEKAGFRPYVRGKSVKAGDRVYRIGHDRMAIFAVIGKEGLRSGATIAAAHIDSPRLDLKTNPLYEDSELAFFKTHYYGGIKKYQWVALPLELRGVIALKSGEVIEVSVGADPADPVFTISDILPHLAQEQMKKTVGEAITGESLNVLLGSIPEPDDEGSDRVKLHVLRLLNQKYGIDEADLHSAELSLVPAFEARDVGFDRSMVGAYGHDDRVCAYGALKAVMDVKAPQKTVVCVLADKEEIGSEGVSGMQSAFFDTFMEDLCEADGALLRACYEQSICLSCDVTAAFDPNYAGPYDKKNSAFLNYGIGITKYTGARGKSGASDASAELVAVIRRILDENDVLWQMGPLGAVDAGGGGTVAKYMANRNIATIDAGVPVLSMHAPYELVSKLDSFMSYRAMLALFSESWKKLNAPTGLR